jgi:dGTPase
VRSRFPDVGDERLVPELVRDQIGLMVGDVLDETGRRLREAGSQSPDEVRLAGRALAGFSSAMAEQEGELKRFLYARMYNAPPVAAVREEAQKVVAGLFAAYRDDPRRLPAGWLPKEAGRVETLRGIGDFIAGMTDRYAIRQYRAEVGEIDLPEAF